MELDDFSIEKINNTLRSLFRYNEIKSHNMSDIILNSEEAILEKRFKMLTANEIFVVVTSWQEYITKQYSIHESENNLIEQHLLTLN